jgi:methionyl-tRNA synthetase
MAKGVKGGKASNENRYYVTTPIYYVNAAPHIGHAYTTIVADVLSRYHKLLGYDSFFMTGTDEHGDKVMRAAKASGKTPKEYADEISSLFRALWPVLMIDNDYFIRTTDPDHVKTVQSILKKVYDNGDIYFDSYGGLYCTGCERFYTERELVDGKCPDHEVEPEFIEEENYFFKMSKYQDWLIDHINKNPDFIRPERYKNEVLAFLREPLEDLCISRPKSRLDWGIELPFDDKYVCYVWFDALINYLTGIGYPDGSDFKKYWPVCQHLVAKDILKPHGIYWPTMLKAAGIEPYRNLNVHGYWNVEESKMSKSLGNIVNPLSLKDKYGLDAFRYFLMRDMVFGLDSSFSEEGLVSRLNADLANDLGNLVSRSLTMASNYFDGVVPEPKEAADSKDDELISTALSTTGEYKKSMDELAFHKALIAVWELISITNRYIVENEPWELVKEKGNLPRLARVIYNVLESLRFVGTMLIPFIPGTAQEILSRVGISGDVTGQRFDGLSAWGGLKSKSKIVVSTPLFPRVDPKKTIKREEAEPKDEKKGTTKKEMELITIDDFKKVELKIGLVKGAEPIEGADKLLKLTVDVGGERTIVAGIAKDYSPDDIVGKQIVVVSNLKPAKLRGIESQGMLLAAEDKDGIAIIAPDKKVKPGQKIV